MKEWFETLNLPEPALYAFLVVLVTLVVRYLVQIAFSRLADRLRHTHNVYDDALIESAATPLATLIWVLGVLWAVEILGAGTDYALVAWVPVIRELAIVTLAAWFIVRFIRYVEDHIADEAYGREKPLDRTTVTAVGKLMRASVIITAVLMGMQTMGLSVSGVLAFGGIGGIAVGFAARDLLANFFGAFIVFIDRPFSVGDWIRSPDRDIEGTVEEIGWRLTRIRTFDQRPLYVPNSVFTAISVENPSRMLNRRINEVVGVRYDDVHALPAILHDVRTMLAEHPDIDTSRTLMVNFDRFAESALEFFIYAFTRTTVWTEYHAVKEDVLLQIAGIVDRHGAEIAFPTRTLHVARTVAEPESP